MKVEPNSEAEDTSYGRNVRSVGASRSSALSPQPSALVFLIPQPSALIFIISCVLTLLSGCAPGVPVSIANHSSHTLENVIVSGAGFSESAGTIGAGNTETVHVRPKGASAFKVAFDVDGQRYSSRSADPDSDNPVSRVAATIDADLSITIETNPQ